MTTSLKDRILFEDNHIIAVNKLPSEIVQGDRTGDRPMAEDVKDYIKEKYNKPGAVFLGVTHRIDRPTSGVVLFARTSKALTRLNKMFQDKAIEKTYWAVVSPSPSKDRDKLVHFLKKHEGKNKSFASDLEKEGHKRAELDYHIIGQGDRYTFVEIHPKTGRHHQIRAQLSAVGCPIKGDLKYGAKRSNQNGSIHLHARQVNFIHPVRQEPIVIAAGPPSDTLWDEFLRLSNINS